jgi:hypothetical protein
LRRIEERHPDEIAVVGVHSGKYDAERITANIRQAVRRLDVVHPVVNDRFFRIWRSYGVSAWPTIVMVDPEGRYIAANPGEITYESFEPVIQRAIEEYDRRGLLDRRPLAFRAEPESETSHVLSFPGKVLFEPPGRLFVADSGHNRVLAVALDEGYRHGNIIMEIGSGLEDFADGDARSAAFHHPQGMALSGSTLLVADAENHSIRAIDLESAKVRTIAGNGIQGYERSNGGPGRRVSLSSPWDLAISGDTVYIAMAGTHQIWDYDMRNGEVAPYAGTGAEAINDNKPGKATLAQTMGLFAEGDRLYFADAESSSVRWADLQPDGKVHTIVGTGLFDFGDKDGTGSDVLLQHNQGITAAGGRLYVADTYNNKIKTVDPSSRRCDTLLGTADPGFEDGAGAKFDEPSGVCAGGGFLFIADTNNHAIRVADLATRYVWTLDLS